ncbi:hypothetical protein RGQ29_029021 [Quercus rubra]|uniref:Uncharacterized protein n=1 Tax=Quercus rubra TaxID=3512 RepID=A0AAN7EUQ3_QUERU|nr:hypothetical protein RGQ29_029021 [Quercus rubra]
MKFEDLLMQRSDERQKRLDLEEEVKKLQGVLDGEQALNRVLRFALEGPVSSHSSLSSVVPPEVRLILEELAIVQEEILWLERKVEELKLILYRQREQNREREMLHLTRLPEETQLLFGQENRSVLNDQRSRSQNYDEFRKERMRKERRPSLGSVSEILSMSSTRFNEDYQMSRRHTRRLIRNQHHINKESVIEKPNELSEKLMKCLISIFFELNQASMEREGSATVPKLTLPCMKSKGFMAKTTFNCKTSTFLFSDNTSNLDPYGILPDFDGTVRDFGPYENFIQVTRSSLDIGHISESLPAMRKLRFLMHRLCNVDLTFLTYKQKLAFWINIYNACIMHAYLEHGLPSTQGKLLDIMNKGLDEKEMLLRHAYGLGYPEPNVTFALCRGSWSSPALRVYTPNEVVNELGKARVEYLEASVGVTSKRKIIVPKLLQWHMRDFADDMESLLEWIYSQLPRSGSLKRLMMECLNGETRSPRTKMVEIQPYEFEFRYLLAL